MAEHISEELLRRKNEKWLLLATLVAVVATAGSLYFSEVLLWIPCKLCWIQRIFMYAIAWMLIVAYIRRETLSKMYILPFVVAGIGFSGYHTIIQKINVDPNQKICTGDVPCHIDYLNLFGVITIPMLALVAFILIGLVILGIKNEGVKQ